MSAKLVRLALISHFDPNSNINQLVREDTPLTGGRGQIQRLLALNLHTFSV
jgi:hypothetical protein